MRKRNAATMREKYPEEMVKRAIWGMIPHNRLGRKMIKKLHVYAGPEHNHEAQQPQKMEIK
jgi:large subunit ribosomal protein L13